MDRIINKHNAQEKTPTQQCTGENHKTTMHRKKHQKLHEKKITKKQGRGDNAQDRKQCTGEKNNTQQRQTKT